MMRVMTRGAPDPDSDSWLEALSDFLGSFFGDFFGEVLICVVPVGLAVAFRVHPIISSVVMVVLLVGTVFFIGRVSARDGHPMTARGYVNVTLLLVAAVAIAAFFVAGIQGTCECF
jgi:hypothetical protein